jgi:Lon protease-like protein
MYSLPLFPLGTVLFPGMPIQLHIFEPRYRLMIRHCLDHNQPFGVALIQHGMEANGPLANPVKIGCAARIVRVDPLDDGRMDLTAVGDDRFRILTLNYDLPYLVGEVESLPLERPHSLEIVRGVRRLTGWVMDYINLINPSNPEGAVDPASLQLPDDPLVMLSLFAALLQVPSAEKQPLLEVTYASEMLDQLLRLYRRETAMLRYARGHNELNISKMARQN